MKEIKILGKIYQYEIEEDFDEYNGTTYETKFYDGVEIVKYRQFWLFGRVLKKAQPKYFFSVYYNIECEKITKKELKEKLLKDFTHHIGLINRQSEIEKGELI